MGVYKKRITVFAVCAFFFILAGVLQYIDKDLPMFQSRICSHFVTIIFLLLIFVWVCSVKARIVQKPTMDQLIAIAVLLFSWLFLRCVKYDFCVKNGTASRYMWYLYYVPQCLVPPIAFVAALGLTRQGNRTNKWVNLIFIPAIILIVLVLTNDLHQAAFRFKPNFENFSSDYTHGVVYYLAIAWIVSVTLAAVATLMLKCRISACRKRVWIPVLVFTVCTLACVLCFLFETESYKVPELLSFSFILIFESCIWIGLIPSNENYAEYFGSSVVASVITDENFNLVFRTAKAPQASRQQYETAKAEGRTFLDEDTCFSHKAISGGSVFFAENLSAVNELLRELSAVGEMLSEESELIAYENELKERKIKIERKNRLYDGILAIVSDELGTVKNLVESINENAPNYERNLRFACVYLAYIKRRSNLEIVSSLSQDLDVAEILLSLKESLGYLSECGVTVSLIDNVSGKYNAEICVLLYEFFEACIKRALPSLSGVIVKLYASHGKIALRTVFTDAAKSAADFKSEKVRRLNGKISVIKEDDCLYQTLTFTTGGEIK